jgi:Ca2+:H+ antiporter
MVSTMREEIETMDGSSSRSPSRAPPRLRSRPSYRLQSVASYRNSRAHGRKDETYNPLLPSNDGTEIQRRALTAQIQPAGESGIQLKKFLKICWLSTSRASRICNILWPVVPTAIAVTYSRADLHLAIFVLNYLAMIPCANMIGFAGQEFSRKLHKVFGVLVETTLGSVVEVVMFIVLVKNNQFQVIQAAILGSVLATQLLCLGVCFVVGGIRHTELEFSPVVAEIGSDLLLTAYVSSIYIRVPVLTEYQGLRTYHSRGILYCGEGCREC